MFFSYKNKSAAINQLINLRKKNMIKFSKGHAKRI